MLLTPQDLWYIVASICLVAITIFLCLVLFRLLHVLKQTDEIVTTTREKLAILEDMVETISERFTSIAGYASLLTEGGKKLLSLIGDHTSGGKKKRKGLRDEEDEE